MSLKRANTLDESDLKLKSRSSLTGMRPVLKRQLSTSIEKYNHLLIARVKDSDVMFSFVIEASIVEVERSANSSMQ